MFQHTKLKFTSLMLVCLMHSHILSAQHLSSIDSLTRILPLCKDDSTKTKVLHELGRDHWFARNFAEAAKYLHQSINLAGKSGTVRWQADDLNLLANVYLKQEVFDSAFNCLEKATALNDENFTPLIDETYSKLYYQVGDYQSSLRHALKSADGFEKSKDPMVNMQLVYAFLTIGEIFAQLGQPEKAFNYYQKAYKKAVTSDKNWYIKTPLDKLANYYLSKKEFEKAKHLYDTIITIDRNSPSHEPTMYSHEGLGNVAMNEQDFSKAINYYKLALRYALQKELAINIENFYTRLGEAFLSADQLDSAQHYLDMAIVRSIKSKNFSNLNKAYWHLSTLQRKQGKYQLALTSLQLQQTYYDSILTIEKIKAVNNLEVPYRTREMENKLLRLQNAEQEKNFAIAIGASIMIAMLTILILIRRNYRHQHHLQIEKVKHMEQQQHVISLQSMVNGQEAERTRIAKDLHDGLGGLFSTVKMHFSTLQHEVIGLKQNELFKKSYHLVDTASTEVRRIAHNMMPEVLMKLGLINAVKDLCDNISAGKLLKIWLQVNGMEKRLNTSTEIMLYRIIQELLNNIIKHANATEAIIQFTRDGDRLSVVVEDNGSGFNTLDADDQKHAGIETIKSRVNYLNGKLTIDSQKDIGTTVMMDFLIHDV